VGVRALFVRETNSRTKRDAKMRCVLRIDIDAVSELSSFKRENARWPASLSDFSTTCTERANDISVDSLTNALSIESPGLKFYLTFMRSIHINVV